MTVDEHEYRRLLCSMSLGYTAYHVWAVQARRERRYNIARLLEVLPNAVETLRKLSPRSQTTSN